MSIFRLVLLSALFMAGFQAHAADHCVVLQYHHISEETPGITSVTPELFQRHLDYLLSNEHKVLALEDVVETLKSGGELPDRCVALTIDDAYLSAYTEAYPRTQRYAFPLTVFINTEVIDVLTDRISTWLSERFIISVYVYRPVPESRPVISWVLSNTTMVSYSE